MTGYLKIKTKLDNKDIDKGIVEIESKIKKLQSENTSLSAQENDLQKEIEKYDKLVSKAEEYKTELRKLEEQKKSFSEQYNGMIPADKISFRDTLMSQIDSLNLKYAQTASEIDKQVPKLEKVSSKLSKINSKQADNNSKIEQFRRKIDAIKADKIRKSINDIGSGITNQISKIGRLAMAVVGIQTAWGLVKRAINLVKQYNPQVATDFQYMGYCIANIVAPAVQWLTRLLYTALSYVNALMQAWFGINIFSKSSAKSFQQMQNGAKSTAKAAKDIQKSLQGFDEMNILQDTSASGDAGGTSATNTPSFDLSGMRAEKPGWLQWIIDNKDVILSVLTGIGAGILAIKLGLGLLKGLGIGIAVAGIVLLIQDIIKFIKDPSFDNFLNILRDIALVVAGIAIAFGLWPVAIVAAVALVVIAIIQNWDKIKDILGKVGNWIMQNVISPVWNFMKNLFESIISIITLLINVVKGIFVALVGILIAPFQEWWNMLKGVFNSVRTMVQGIFNVFKGIFTGDMKTVFNGFKQIFKGAFDSLWSIAKAPLNLVIRGINALIKGANKIHFDVPSWVPGIGGKTYGINIPQIPLLAKGGVVSQPTQAIIGEAGKEAVLPLEKNTEWLDILANKLASKIGNDGGAYIINLDSRVIQRGIAKKKQELAFASNGR